MANKNDPSPSKNRILLLQNVTLKPGNPFENPELERRNNGNNSSAFNSDFKENLDPKINMTNRSSRCTASSYFFDEEPCFSDSDEEQEYCRLITSQKSLCYTNEISENVSVAIQCNLHSEELELVDIIEKCASINTDEVNEDFKQLIDLCKKLQFKYKKPNNVTTNDPPTPKETLDVNKNPLSVPPLILPSKVFFPSKNGSSCGSNSSGFSEEHNLDTSNLNITTIIKSLDYSTTKINRPVRRSNRPKKPINLTRRESMIEIPRKKRIPIRVVDLERKSGKNKKGSVTLPVVTSGKVVNMEDPSVSKCRYLEVTKSLARRWMKPTMTILRDSANTSELSSIFNNCKRRRLYSPNLWMHSEELTDLCNSNERSSSSF